MGHPVGSYEDFLLEFGYWEKYFPMLESIKYRFLKEKSFSLKECNDANDEKCSESLERNPWSCNSGNTWIHLCFNLHENLSTKLISFSHEFYTFYIILFPRTRSSCCCCCVRVLVDNCARSWRAPTARSAQTIQRVRGRSRNGLGWYSAEYYSQSSRGNIYLSSEISSVD